MKRKVIFNIVLSLVVLPFISFISFLQDEIGEGNWGINSIYAEVIKFLYEEWYLIPYLFILIFILLPYQLVKDYLIKKNRRLGFAKKNLIFLSLASIIVAVGWLSVYGMWTYPWWENYVYLLFAVLFSFFCTSFLYLSVDRFVEKRDL